MGRASRIAVVATGGTIANTPGRRLALEEVLADIDVRHPELGIADRFAIEVDEVVRDGAENFDPTVWSLIAAAVQRASDRDDVDGVVVTHGTYTVEETAYLLHLTVDTGKPLVLTCSQRKHGTLGNDGDRNLYDALRVASSAEAAGLGAVLVANEEVHCGREVIKASRRPGGFVSPVLGPLGFVDEDRVSLYRAPLRRHTRTSDLRRPSDGAIPEVVVIGAHPGASGLAITDAVAGGVRGIVVHGYTYAGKPAPEQIVAAREAVAAGVPVVLVSRGREGRIPLPAQPDGFVRADSLTTSKAVVLLVTALRHGVSATADLQVLYDTH